MGSARSFSIVTTCMDRLDDLKRTLPLMVDQGSAEVIVVDFSCPQGTGAYVAKHFPSVRVVSVEGQRFFSNWKARNAGAAAATSDMIIFCDADVMLAKNAVDWIAGNLPDNALGHFTNESAQKLEKKGRGRKRALAFNQLKGFHVVPTAAFRAVEGYDDVPQGYGAGGDSDLVLRLRLYGLEAYPLPVSIIDDVIEQDRAARMKHHGQRLAVSYCAGVLYRAAKFELLRLTGRSELPLKARINLYRKSLAAARRFGRGQPTTNVSVDLHTVPVLMPRELGFSKVRRRVSLNVELTGSAPLARK
jgi:hypothetical protein